MANNITINVRAVVDKAISEVDKMKASLNNLSTSEGFKSAVMGVGMGAGVAAFNAIGSAIGGAVQSMGGAIQAASNLTESTSKAQVVFGDAMSGVQAFADTSARSFGISKQAALEAMGTFGNLFNSVGMGKSAAAEMSVNITQLAADLASFNNVTNDEALMSLRSGLLGEAEPMRKFGVLLTEAAVKAKAMEMGLVSANGVLSESAKVQARYAIILAQTGTAQGDFARTSGNLAAQQKIMNAEIENASASIGTHLIPMYRDLVVGINEVFDAMERLGPQWRRLGFEGVEAQKGQLEADMLASIDRAVAAQQARIAAAGPLTGKAWEDYVKASFSMLNAAIWRAGQGSAEAAAEIPGLLSAAVAAGSRDQRNYEASLASSALASSKLRAELVPLVTAFRTTAAVARQSRLDAAYAISELPGKIIVAKGAVVEARVALEMAHTNVEKAAAKLRLRDAQKEVMDLQATLLAAGGGVGAAGAMIGTELGYNLYAQVVAWNNKTRAELSSLGQAAPGIRGAGGRATNVDVVGKPTTTIPSVVPYDPTTDASYKALLAAARAAASQVGGSSGGGGSASISTAAADAKAKLKQLADDAKTNLGTAFDRIKTSTNKFFDDLHTRTLKAKTDAHDLANAQLDAQIGGINANVQAARDALQATRDARTLSSLQTAVGTADTPEAQAAAQQALSDFQAEQAINAMEKDAQVKIDALTLQKTANDDALKEEIRAEDERYKAQTTAYELEMKNLQAYLDKHPAAWKKTSDDVLKVLIGQGVTYAAAGAYLGSAFATGLAGDEKGLQKSAQAYGATSKAAGQGNITINVNGAGDPAAVAESIMQALKREQERQHMSLG